MTEPNPAIEPANATVHPSGAERSQPTIALSAAGALARWERRGWIDAALALVALAQAVLFIRSPLRSGHAPPLWVLLAALATWALLALGAIAPLTRRDPGLAGELPRGAGLWLGAYGMMALAWIFILFNLDPDRFWGFWHLVRLDPGEFAVGTTLLPLVLAPGWRRLAREARVRRAWRAIRRLPRGVRWALAAGIFAGYFAAFSDRAIMSDGWGFAALAGAVGPLDISAYREPLANLIFRGAVRLLAPLGLYTPQVVGIVSTAAMLGVLALFGWRMRGWGFTRRQRAIGWWLVFSSLAITQFLLGRVEAYGLVQLSLAATAVTSLAAMEGRCSPGWPAACYALALPIHVASIVMLPACALAAWFMATPTLPAAAARGKARVVAIYLGSAAIASLIAWGALMAVLRDATPAGLVRAVMSAVRISPTTHTVVGWDQPRLLAQLMVIFGPENLFKVVQVLFMLAGGAFLAGLLMLFSRRRGAGQAAASPDRTDASWRREMAVLGALWACFLMYSLVMHAVWSWTEDWDLFSGFAPLSVLLVARWAMPARGVVRLPPRLARQVCAFALALAATQHYYNHTRAAYLSAGGTVVSDDREHGRMIQSYQFEHGFEYGSTDRVENGVVRRLRPGNPANGDAQGGAPAPEGR